MKRYVWLVFLFYLFYGCQTTVKEASQNELPDDYLRFTLNKLNDKFEGGCEYLEGFTLSMNVHPESFGKDWSERALLSTARNQEITGTLDYPDGRSTDVQYETVFHREAEEIYMKTTLGYFLWENVRVSENSIVFDIYWWYCPPAREVDFEALEMAEQLLSDPARWHKNDDRKCEDDIENNHWSLFCALKYASLEKMGEYNHHNTAMQTVRLVIDEFVPDHGFDHTLMDYNNSSQTTHNDILKVLHEAKLRIRKELK